jgi:hypothetical protein
VELAEFIQLGVEPRLEHDGALTPVGDLGAEPRPALEHGPGGGLAATFLGAAQSNAGDSAVIGATLKLYAWLDLLNR